MKKTLSIALIIALIGVVLCFAACGGGGNVDDLSTTGGEMTSMLDEATTLMDEMEEGLSDMFGDDETTEEDTTSGDETTSQEATTGGETTTAQ